jgi:hypothetical protein
MIDALNFRLTVAGISTLLLLHIFIRLLFVNSDVKLPCNIKERLRIMYNRYYETTVVILHNASYMYVNQTMLEIHDTRATAIGKSGFYKAVGPC